jgi:hypothetical protein
MMSSATRKKACSCMRQSKEGVKEEPALLCTSVGWAPCISLTHSIHQPSAFALKMSDSDRFCKRPCKDCVRAQESKVLA